MWKRVVLGAVVVGVVGVGIGVATALADEPPVAPKPAAEPTIVERLREEAQRIEPLLASDAARRFVRATSALPDPCARVVYRNRAKGLALSEPACRGSLDGPRHGAVGRFGTCDQVPRIVGTVEAEVDEMQPPPDVQDTIQSDDRNVGAAVDSRCRRVALDTAGPSREWRHLDHTDPCRGREFDSALWHAGVPQP